MAAENAFECEPETLDWTVLAEGLEGVLGTSWGEAAARRFQRGDADLVETDQHDKGPDQDLAKYAILSAHACCSLCAFSERLLR